MNTFYYSFGCKVNQYETENIRQRMENRGYSTSKNIADSDIFIVNTCTVTAQSDHKCRQLIHKIKKQRPDSILVLTGCFPQAFRKQAIEMTECDIITGSSDKGIIPQLIEEYLTTGQRIIRISEHVKAEKFEDMKNLSFEAKTRAFVKIQDGCDQYCTYCIIPYARGHIRSKKLEDIYSEISALAEKGHREVVLVGINLCCYGKDFCDGTRLVDAIEKACSVEGIDRVRLGSIEPEMILDEDIERMGRLKKLCPQFHLSLQSGCDRVLKRMNRKYNTEEYAALCNKLRSVFRDCSITTDIMVGFAGETEEDFLETINFAEKIGFAKVHIFPYSVRQGTVAEGFEGQLDKSVKDKRAQALEKVCSQSAAKYLNSMVGTVVKVLFEKESSPLWHNGHCENYTLVKVPARENDKSLRWEIRDVKIVSAQNDCCIGELI